MLITDHDRPVAKLVPASAENGLGTPDSLSLLERRGIIRRGQGAPCRLSSPPKPRNDASAPAALLDERERGR